MMISGKLKSMNNKLYFITILCLALAACANPKPAQHMAAPMTSPEHSLAEASYSVSRSMVNLAETAEAAHPERPFAPPPDPNSYGMGGLTTIDWSGPVEPLLRQIASSSNYRLRVLGNKPNIPILVTVQAKNVMLGDALRDVGYQCGKRAKVVVFPENQVIELRYAKN